MSRRRLRYAAAGLAMALLLALSAPVASAAQTVPARPVLEYKGESGVRIVSYSTRWNTREQLKALHDELLNNFHSEELAYLDAVILYPGEAPDGVAGRWRGEWTKRGDGPWQLNPGRIIELYRADEITSLDLMARTLSHEYGHHFTSYWLLKHEGLLFRDWRKTEWARIRGLSNFPQVGSGYHSWEPQEIAAEDYIQLFGSPLAREALVRNVPMGDGRYIPAEIQENAAIPLAWDTPGLYEYWRKALGPAAPAPVQPIPPPTLRFVSASPTRWNTTEVTLEWAPGHGMPPGGQFYLWQDNVPAPEQIRLDWKYPGYLVQPLTYDGPGLERITVQAQPIVAPDGGLMTRYRFYVVAVHNGQIVSSNKVVLEGVNTPSPRLVTEEPLKVPPAITPGARLWDIRNHWAEAQIRALVDQGVVNGYPDGSFKPEQPITRAEFLKLLASALGYQPQEGTPPDFAGLAKHWLATGGWLAPLAEAGTIQPGELLTAADLDVRLSRQEMARYLVRALGQPPSSEPVAMSDAFQIGSAFRGYVSAAVQLGLLQGIPDGAGGVAFRPLDSTTRAQAAVVLSRLLDRVRR